MAIIILYASITSYNAKLGEPKNAAAWGDASTEETIHRYPFFQDVHVMIFIGFGFLMTFLKTYSWSAVGMNFIVGAFVVQWSIITNGLWKNAVKNQWSTIEISIDSIIDADFAAASILIAVGAVLGKLNFLQYMFMAIFQTVFYSLAYNIGIYKFKAVDIGGSMYIHAFGAYFGLAASLAYRGKTKNFKRCAANYNSNTFAFIGTIFLWIFWPSFNGALSSGNAQQRAIINTYLSLTGSCISVFIISPMFRHDKFNAEFILNATLAGGVMIGNTADLIFKPWEAIFIGFLAGFASLLGYVGVNQFLFKKIDLHDTCGVHYLHGITGVFGGIIGIIFAAIADPKDLGESYKILYPNSDTRTPSEQALNQLAALAVVLGIAIFTGFICGLFLRCFKGVDAPFDDEELWEVEEDELELVRWMEIHETVKSRKNENRITTGTQNNIPNYRPDFSQNENKKEKTNDPKKFNLEFKNLNDDESNNFTIKNNRQSNTDRNRDRDSVNNRQSINGTNRNQESNLNVNIEENPNLLRNMNLNDK